MSPVVHSRQAAPGVLNPAKDEDAAAAVLFPLLCRQSPALRDWLWGEFARDPKTRARFAKILQKGSATLDGAHGFDEITDASKPWKEERRRLKKEMPEVACPYGGLTWSEMETLVRHYQAGTIDLRAFLLAHNWRAAGEAASTSPALAIQAAEFVDAVVRLGQKRLLRHLGKATAFLDSFAAQGNRRTAIGYQGRWKLYTLFYMLRHPRLFYRTRDLRAHLTRFGIQIDAKDVRRFCKRHSIRRDERAGRPRRQAL